MQRFRELFTGGDRSFGLLLLPLFLMTALLGATLAGALVILYYGQQVSRLEAETSDARAQVLEAREEVLEAAEEARRAIEQQVEEVRQALADDPPIEGPDDAGVYAIAASHANGERRVGSGFTLASADGEAIVVTTYRLVATEDGFAVPSVEVLLPGRTATARVHNFDRGLDVATLVMSGGSVPVTDWRPADEDLGRGDRLYLAGIAGPGAAAVLQGSVGSVAPEAVVPSIPVNDFLAGGPLLDSIGRVVAVASLNYLPFGRVAGEVAYGVPIRALCRELIECADADQGTASLRGEGGRGERAEPPREPPPPLPSPEPLPPPEPESESESESEPEPEPEDETPPSPTPTTVPRPPPPPSPDSGTGTQPPATTAPAPG